MQKHRPSSAAGGLQSTGRDQSPTEDQPRALSLEAQIVNIADEIAYTSHDAEDGVRANLFTLDAIAKTALGKKATEKSRPRGTSLRGALIHLLVTDLYETSAAILTQKNIRSLDDVYAAKTALISFSTNLQKDLTELRDFLWKQMYLHPTVLAASERGKKILWDLCEELFSNPTEKVLNLQKRTKSLLHDAVKDYVAGMTDSFVEEAAANK